MNLLIFAMLFNGGMIPTFILVKKSGAAQQHLGAGAAGSASYI